MLIPLECGGFFRTFIGTTFKYPLTLSLVGYQGMPIGVKVVIFDTFECRESGMFFTVNPELWRKKIIKEAKKRTKKYMNVIPLEGDFDLHYILEKVGFRILMSAMQFEKGNNGTQTIGRVLVKGNMSVVDNLENLMTMTNVIEVYRNE